MAEGNCLCGSVRFTVEGPFHMMLHCHCSMCRKHHGSAFATFVAAPLAGFKWRQGSGLVARYRSSDKGERSFCLTCGSVMPILAQSMDLAICPAGNLQGDLDVRPERHLFVRHKAPWYEITDDLPQHEEYPPEFGATGVERPAPQVREGTTGGSCLCGAVAYEIAGPLLRMMNCHCTRCRRARSAAHATNGFCKVEDFRFTRGEDRLVDYKVPEARFFAVAFCRDCGGAMPRISRERGIVVVPAGSLDCDPGVRPAAHIFVGSKANWFQITDQVPQLEAAPPPA